MEYSSDWRPKQCILRGIREFARNDRRLQLQFQNPWRREHSSRCCHGSFYQEILIDRGQFRPFADGLDTHASGRSYSWHRSRSPRQIERGFCLGSTPGDFWPLCHHDSSSNMPSSTDFIQRDDAAVEKFWQRGLQQRTYGQRSLLLGRCLERDVSRRPVRGILVCPVINHRSARTSHPRQETLSSDHSMV